MTTRATRRSAFLGVGLVLLAALPVVADQVRADADTLTAGPQPELHLGTVTPGAVIERDVDFTLICNGLRHADPGQTITLFEDTTTIPIQGGSITGTPASIGPVPSSWVSDAGGAISCPTPMSHAGSTPSHVTIVAPPVAGDDYPFTITYRPSLSPVGVSDATSVTGLIAATFILDVVDTVPDTVPPTLSDVPSDIAVTTSNPGGEVVAYTPPTATDDVDPAPVVDCTPPSSSIFAVGTTTVTCTAGDASGNTASASFDVTVTFVEPPDTTPPQLSVSADLTTWTDDPAGAAVTYDAATAIDDRDPAPTVGCAPGSGTVFALGTTTVACTATDAVGNSATATFDVTVLLTPDTTAPELVGLPAGVDARTQDPAGMVVSYELPTATDNRDPAPAVACSPPPGSTFAVGTTTVTCTATDASGNVATGSFVVHVRHVSAVFAEPIGDDGITVKVGRVVHVKTQAFLDGVAQGGTGSFVVTGCNGGTELVVAADWAADTGRWTASIDTALVDVGCHRVGLVIDAVEYGSFQLTVEAKGPGANKKRG